MEKNNFLNLLTELISIKSVSGDFIESKRLLDLLEQKISRKAVFTRINNNGVEILLASNKKTKKPDIGFMIHADVVAAKDKQFTLTVKKDKILGRGVSDMKFSIPMGIELLNLLTESESKLSFMFIVTTDEETGGFSGAKFLADNYCLRPKCLIVPDGGDNLNFVTKAKGVCQLVLKFKGSPAHASRPWMGKNALEPLIKITNSLLAKYSENNKTESWKTTMNIGQIQGGVSVNQVCPEATLKLDFRFPETDSIDRIKNEVYILANKIDKNIEISVASTGLPTFTDISLPTVKLFLDCMKKKMGLDIKTSQTYGASDARHFSDFDIPILMMKPMGGEIHSDSEWISLESCLKFYDGLRLFVSKLEMEVI